MSRSVNRDPRSRERGATAVFVALTLGVVAGFLALALNVGHLFAVRAELQNASDSAALAGAADLGGDNIGELTKSFKTARDSAVTYARYHKTDDNTGVSDPDVCVGQWHIEDPTLGFQCLSDSPTADAALSAEDAYKVNAVRVSSARDSSHAGGALPVFLAGLLGTGTPDTADVRAPAIAARFGPCSDSCAFPIAFAACQVYDGTLPCAMKAVLSSAIVDNTGLTIYDENNQANLGTLVNLLGSTATGTCKTKAQYCANPPVASTLPDPPAQVKMQNGNIICNPNVLASLKCLQGMTIDAGVIDVPCSGGDPQFSGTHSLLGFTRVTIGQVDCTGIEVTRDCNITENGSGRCLSFGILNTRPVLVQ